MSDLPIVSYDSDLYCSDRLRFWADLYAKALPPNVNFLISAGTSGATIAAGILMLRNDLVHVHVHPKGRLSHRGTKKIFSGFSHPEGYGVFVDDFIDSGTTARKAISTYLDERCDITFHEHANQRIKCILVSGYCSWEDGRNEQKLSDYFNIPIVFANGIDTIYPRKASQ